MQCAWQVGTFPLRVFTSRFKKPLRLMRAELETGCYGWSGGSAFGGFIAASEKRMIVPIFLDNLGGYDGSK